LAHSLRISLSEDLMALAHSLRISWTLNFVSVRTIKGRSSSRDEIPDMSFLFREGIFKRKNKENRPQSEIERLCTTVDTSLNNEPCVRD
jgi:hypothetical protein